MNSREVIKALKAAGWIHTRTKGDHWHFHHPTIPGIATVPHPKKDIAIAVIKFIEQQTGLKLR